MEFEFTHFKASVQHFSYITENPPRKEYFSSNDIWTLCIIILINIWGVFKKYSDRSHIYWKRKEWWIKHSFSSKYFPEAFNSYSSKFFIVWSTSESSFGYGMKLHHCITFPFSNLSLEVNFYLRKKKKSHGERSGKLNELHLHKLVLHQKL